MNKEEILVKSRLEKNDEGLKEAENQGRRVGEIALLVVFIVLIVANSFSDEKNYSVLAMFWAFMSAEAWPKYRFTGDKSYMITTICGAFASLAFVLAHMIYLFS